MSTYLLLIFVVYAAVFSVVLSRAGYRSRAAETSTASGQRPTKVLIVGASGRTGKHLVMQALEGGYAVTAFVRKRSRLPLEHPELSVVEGDVLDADSVDGAMRGQDAVLCALGHKRFLGPTRILSRGTRNLLQAMKKHGAQRLVCESSLGIGDSAGRMGLYYTLLVIPLILPFYFWDKTRQERAIAESDVGWVIVRPGVLTNGAQRGRYRHGFQVGNFLWTVRISRADVAMFMVDQLESDTYLRTAPGVCW